MKPDWSVMRLAASVHTHTQSHTDTCIHCAHHSDAVRTQGLHRPISWAIFVATLSCFYLYYGVIVTEEGPGVYSCAWGPGQHQRRRAGGQLSCVLERRWERRGATVGLGHTQVRGERVSMEKRWKERARS
jgi:hypothetical protein